jgi:hypothetical protein
VEAGGESELKAWYEQEHLPGSAAVPGCLRARRFMRGAAQNALEPEVSPRWPLDVASYDLSGSKVTESAPLLVVPHTDWCSRARPLFRKTRSTLFIRPDLQP